MGITPETIKAAGQKEQEEQKEKTKSQEQITSPKEQSELRDHKKIEKILNTIT